MVRPGRQRLRTRSGAVDLNELLQVRVGRVAHVTAQTSGRLRVAIRVVPRVKLSSLLLGSRAFFVADFLIEESKVSKRTNYVTASTGKGISLFDRPAVVARVVSYLTLILIPLILLLRLGDVAGTGG